MNAGSILVTGAAGMVGGAVTRRLVLRGARVIGTDLRQADALDCPFVAADLVDAHRIDEILRVHRVEAVVHCGGVSGSMVSVDDPMNIVRANVSGTANILEAARTMRIGRVVFCSSASIYGATPPDPVVEEVPLHPISVYGASKIAGEALLEAYATQWGLDAVALRIFQVYGPGRTTECQIRSMLTGGLLGQPVVLPFSPLSRRQYVHVDDVVDAVEAALQAAAFPRRTYNVCGDESITLARLAELVSAVIPGTEVRFAPTAKSAPNARGRVDTQAAHRDLGFRPKVALQDGISSYARWLAPRLTTSVREGPTR